MQRNLPYIGKYMSKWLVVAAFMGIRGGISAALLRDAISRVETVSQLLMPAHAPVIGGIILSVIFLWDPAAKGFSADHCIYDVNQGRMFLRSKTALSKLIATAVTLGFRGSGGVTNPMLVIGGSIADSFSRMLF